MRAGLGLVLGARARLRWVHLILGGALLMPYFLLAQVVVSVATGGGNIFGSTPLTFASYGLSLPMAAVTAVFGLVRPMSVGAIRALCGVPGERLAEGPARSWAARGRTSAWWTLHLGVGAVVSGLTLAVPPMAVVLITLPFVSGLRKTRLGLG
ncbi:histidine kinase, partial [Streptomyces sp. NRRL S-444]